MNQAVDLSLALDFNDLIRDFKLIPKQSKMHGCRLVTAKSSKNKLTDKLTAAASKQVLTSSEPTYGNFYGCIKVFKVRFELVDRHRKVVFVRLGSD